MAPRTRVPTGKPSWPLILVEGAEKSGKSWMAAELSASKKVGQVYWIDIGEGAADEYAAIPGADYLVIDHNGSWADIITQVEEVRQVAAAEQEAGRAPVVLVIDSMTNEWGLLKEIGDRKARARAAKKGRSVAADEEVEIHRDIWNVLNGRHRRLMTMLMTWPGIVVMTARGKEVAATDKAGNPIPGRREYKVEGQKDLAFDAAAWVRLSRDAAPKVIGLRGVRNPVRPGVHPPVETPDLSLEWLIFDVIGCEAGATTARDLKDVPAERSADEIAAEALKPETGCERLRELHREAKALALLDTVVSDGNGTEGVLRGLIAHLGRTRTEQPAPAPANAPPPDAVADTRRALVERLWARAGDFDDPNDRLAYTCELIGRIDVTSGEELTGDEIGRVIAGLERYIAQNTPPTDTTEVEPSPAGGAYMDGEA